MKTRCLLLGMIVSLTVTMAAATAAQAGTDYYIADLGGACAATGDTKGWQKELRYGVYFKDIAGNPVDGVDVLVRVEAEGRKRDSLVWATSVSVPDGPEGYALGIDPEYIKASATKPKLVTYTVLQVIDPAGYEHNPSLDVRTTFSYLCR